MIPSRTIDGIRSCDMFKIYCDCGNIVSLDKCTVRMKKQLKKDIECTVCRNYRISMDIDHINSIFDGTLDEESTA
ncbi:MAG: hypothetical protein FWD81_05515 [Methanomassiliicoccaceae archaeon]|nr:hypothetical protein [Methanomassiliicoccaceae archaeon]